MRLHNLNDGLLQLKPFDAKIPPVSTLRMRKPFATHYKPCSLNACEAFTARDPHTSARTKTVTMTPNGCRNIIRILNYGNTYSNLIVRSFTFESYVLPDYRLN